MGAWSRCGAPSNAVITLDLRRLQGVEVDHTSLTATLGPGLRGPEAEEALAAQGVTLGHFPQSFEYATIGGFAAARSAGQASSGYGRFDELVTSLRLTAPAGTLSTLKTPHTAAGPALRELALGSEGALGVITQVTARVRPVPERRRYDAWMAADFASGADIVRALAQSRSLPDVIRVSDEAETRTSLAMSGTGGGKRALLGGYLRLRRRDHGSIMICGWEGEGEAVERRRSIGTRILRSGGAAALGSAPGRAWERGRYDGPYLRDALMDLGYMAETLETSHNGASCSTFTTGFGPRSDPRSRPRAPTGWSCVTSRTRTRDGASLYFTFIAPRRPAAELEQWGAAKTAASEAIVEAGGTITHHHGVGRDHVPYMGAEIGELGIDALRAVKERLDPDGIMNPGKLLP